MVLATIFPIPGSTVVHQPTSHLYPRRFGRPCGMGHAEARAQILWQQLLQRLVVVTD